MSLRSLHLIVTLLICAACAVNSPSSTAPPVPTEMAATASPAPRLVEYPTRELQPVASVDAPTLAPTDTPMATLPPVWTATAAAVDPFPAVAAPVTARTIVIGESVEGRTITARQLGDGARVLLLVGGMHGGWEANTVELVERLTAHFEAHPEDVLPGVTLVLVAAANPDGLEHGRTSEGRFNANGVDLNRNWACDWSPDAVWRSERVNAGTSAFSEPETLALAEYIRGLRPAAVLFYHSAANGVYAGDCDSDTAADSHALEAVVGEAAGYRYGQPFSAYTVTGTAPNWVDGIGIPAVDVELRTATDAEFAANLRGVMAAQRWVLGQE